MADAPAEPLSPDVVDDALVLLLTVVDAERRLDDAAMAEIEAFGRGGDPVDRLRSHAVDGNPVPRSVVLAGISLFSAALVRGRRGAGVPASPAATVRGRGGSRA